MSWILLLIQLLPSVIKIIEAIRDLIVHLPHNDRIDVRRDMRLLAKKHVRELSLAHAAFAADANNGMRFDDAKGRAIFVEDEWRDLLARVRKQAGVAS